MLVKLSRLQETLYKPQVFSWNEKSISVEDIVAYLSENDDTLEDEFGVFHTDQQWTDLEHIQRVAYFVRNPDEIKSILVDNACIGSYILPYTICIDGNHRLLAAITLKLDYVDIRYGGRTDLLDYITGNIDILPIE